MKPERRPSKLLPIVLWRVLPLAFLALVGVWYVASQAAERTVHGQVGERLKQSAFHSAKEIASRLRTLEETAQTLATNDLVANSLIDTIERERYIGTLFQSLQVPGSASARVYLLDYRGRVIAANGPAGSFEGVKWLDGVIEGQGLTRISSEGIIVARPILYQGQPEGVIVIAYDGAEGQQVLAVEKGLGETLVLGEQREVLYSSSEALASPKAHVASLDASSWLQAEAEVPGYQHLVLVVAASAEEALGVVHDIRQTMLLAIAVSMAALVGGIVLAAYLATQPLSSFIGSIRKVADSSQLGQQIEPSASAEFHDLAESFNAMTERLRRTTTSRDWVDNILNSMGESLIVTDSEGSIQFANRAALKTFRCSQDAIKGRSITDVFVDKDTREVLGEVRPERARVGVQSVEAICALSVKEGIPVLVSASALGDGAMEKDGIVYVAQDIAERKKAEQELETAQERLIAAIESISDAFALFDADDRLVIFNSKFLEQRKESADALKVGAKFEDIIRRGAERGRYVEALGRIEAFVEERLQQHRNPGEPIEQQLCDGRWLRIQEQRMPDGSIVGIRTDITALKQREVSLQQKAEELAQANSELEQQIALRRETEHSLRESEEQTRAIFEIVADGIITIDPEGTVETFNPAAERLFGRSKEEVIGQNVRLLMPAPDQDRHDGYIRSYLKGGQARLIGKGREFQGLRGDDSTFPIELSVTEMVVGEERKFTGVVRDISERKDAERKIREREEALQQRVSELENARHHLEQKGQELARLAEDLKLARDAAEAANRAKSDFLATMSHEIRTPMNGIIGMTELLLETDLGEKQRDHASTVLNSAETLLSLINDILDFSKIESGRLELEPLSFDLLSLADDTAEILAVKSREKAVDLMVRYVPGTPRFVVGDAVRLRQILYNLIGNAIKFTEKGHVLTTVEAVSGSGLAPGQCRVRVSVEDTGIGIPVDRLGAVFERFAQADSSTTRRYGGTGLGLAICKQLVEMMGGEIGVKNNPQGGATFWFTVELKVDETACAVEPDHKLLAGVRALVVDDIEVNRQLVHEQLAAAGMRCTSCGSGEEALVLLRDAKESGDPFELGFIDYMMPEMDGEALSRAIKSDARLKDTALIVLTSAGGSGFAKRLHDSGAAALLTKPIRRLQLLDTAAAVSRARQSGSMDTLITLDSARVAKKESTASGAGEAPLDSVRVLLAEDNRVNLAFATETLENLGCDVAFAENGKVAVESVKAAVFDVILMDCQMPVMDGFEASRIITEMKARGEISDIPIIALTANAMKGDKEKCLAAGMNDYLTKPIRKKTLQEAIERWLPQARGADLSADQEKDNASMPDTTETSQGFEVLDLEALGEVKAAMRDKFTAMVDYYLEDSASYITQIDAALADGAIDKAISPAHTLKSSSKQLGVMQVSEFARQLEEQARSRIEGNGSGGQDIASLFNRLREAFEFAEPQLKKLLEEAA